MNFTMKSYRDLLNEFKRNNYKFIFFGENSKEDRKELILRHDVDLSLEAALKMAKLETELNIKSTYFILLGTSFYNPMLAHDKSIIRHISELGHDIGLHFDISNYLNKNDADLVGNIKKELTILSFILDKEVNVVSFHRPTKELLNKKLSDDIISAYERKYFNEFTYISDSRSTWKNSPYDLIDNSIKRIQCLTHPIWYWETDIDKKTLFKHFMNEQKTKVANALNDNISNLEELIGGPLCNL